jgi:aminopeptidase N
MFWIITRKSAPGHFEQVKGMLECFEHYLGEFPFWNDGYALVETPYWGMEHQSCIAYGNDLRTMNMVSITSSFMKVHMNTGETAFQQGSRRTLDP